MGIPSITISLCLIPVPHCLSFVLEMTWAIWTNQMMGPLNILDKDVEEEDDAEETEDDAEKQRM